MKSLLQKLLPLDRLIQLGLRLGLLSKPLVWASKLASNARGARTEILLAVSGLLGLAGFLGVIDMELAKSLIATMLTAAAPTLLDKVDRVLTAAELVKNQLPADPNL